MRPLVEGNSYQPLDPSIDEEELKELKRILKDDNKRKKGIKIRVKQRQINPGWNVGVVKHKSIILEITPKWDLPLRYMLLYTQSNVSFNVLLQRKERRLLELCDVCQFISITPDLR